MTQVVPKPQPYRAGARRRVDYVSSLRLERTDEPTEFLVIDDDPWMADSATVALVRSEGDFTWVYPQTDENPRLGPYASTEAAYLAFRSAFLLGR